MKFPSTTVIVTTALIAAVVVWASNNVDAVEDLLS